ncbi:hypothetical protein ACOSQ2_019305 [Xanthoceras sorbifolium]
MGAPPSYLPNHSFHEEEADAILSILSASRFCADSYCWHYDARGIFSFKSGYWLSMRNYDQPSGSTASSISAWWRALWKLNIPHKISSLKLVRKLFPSLSSLRWRGFISFLDFALECHAAIVPWARSFLSDFQVAGLSPPKPLARTALKWVALSPSWFKLNSDVVVDVTLKRVGLGVVIRDWKGCVAAAFAKHLPVLLPVDCAEALAILEWLKFAASMWIFPIGVESDAATVVGAIRSNSPPHSELSLIVDEILDFASGFPVVNFYFCSRLCNSVAHDLGKLGISSSAPYFLFEETPPCVTNLVSCEFLLC